MTLDIDAGATIEFPVAPLPFTKSRYLGVETWSNSVTGPRESKASAWMANILDNAKIRTEER